jgi:hypothetical protein
MAEDGRFLKLGYFRTHGETTSCRVVRDLVPTRGHIKRIEHKTALGVGETGRSALSEQMDR